MEQFAEHRIDIFLVANVLHSKVLKGFLQMLIFAPQRLVRAAGYLYVAVVTAQLSPSEACAA